MSDLVARLTSAAARALTDEAKADTHALWAKLRALYDGDAHTALGYTSWADYCDVEFDMGKSHAYRVIDAARVVELIPQLGNETSESVARELVPILREDPEEVEEVWAEAVEEFGPSPTARQVRSIVKAKPGLGNYSNLDDDHAVDPWDGDVVFSFQFRQRVRKEIREINRMAVDRLRNTTRQGDAGSPARLASEVGDLTKAIKAARTTHGPAHDVALGNVRDCARAVAVSAFLYGVTVTQPPELARGDKSSTETYKLPI